MKSLSYILPVLGLTGTIACAATERTYQTRSNWDVEGDLITGYAGGYREFRSTLEDNLLNLTFSTQYGVKKRGGDPWTFATFSFSAAIDVADLERSPFSDRIEGSFFRIPRQSIVTGAGDIIHFAERGFRCEGLCALTYWDADTMLRVDTGVRVTQGRYSVSNIPLPASGLFLLLGLGALGAHRVRLGSEYRSRTSMFD